MPALTRDALQRIKAHAMEKYPEECCGMLLGGERGDRREIRAVLRLDNSHPENRGRRFLITPEAYREAEAAAEARGLAVMGFYHSHPDHPARPSQFDLEHAWPWCSYIIASVERGVPTAVKSWVLREDRSGFDEEIIEENAQWRHEY